MPDGAALPLPPSAAAGFTYGGGKASQEFAFPPGSVQAAVVAALDDLKVEEVRQRNDGPSSLFAGSTKDARPVTVTVRPGVGAGRVTTRIGWFGDEPYSKARWTGSASGWAAFPRRRSPKNPPSPPSPNPFFRCRAVSDATMLRDHAEAAYRDSLVPRD